MKMRECLEKIETLQYRIEALDQAISLLTARSDSDVAVSITIVPESMNNHEKVIKAAFYKEKIIEDLQKELSGRKKSLSELKNIVEKAEQALSRLEEKGE